MKPKPEIILGALLATAFWAMVSLFFQPSASMIAFWKDSAGPIATLGAAIAAGWVAYQLGHAQISVAETQADIARRNWETANEKVVLELFERRLAIYDAIRDIIGEVTRTGVSPDEILHKYFKALDHVPYFFGEEVQNYLESVRLLMIDLNLANTMMEDPYDRERAKWVQMKHDRFSRITRFYNDAPPLFGPYIRAHQKTT